MFVRPKTLFLFAAASVLASCTTVKLPEVDFMGDSQFEDDLSALESGYPRTDETPDIPNDVRSAAEWDQSAREMQALYDKVDAPELEPSLSDEEFESAFDAAKAATREYEKDDPS